MSGTFGNDSSQRLAPAAMTTVELSEGWRLALVTADSWLAGYGPATRRAYETDLRDYYGFCWARGVEPLSSTRADVDRYLRSLVGERNLSGATAARRLSALSACFRYAADEEVITRNPARRARRPKVAEAPPRIVLSRADVVLLIGAGREHSPRAAALVTLLALTGLRAGEALGSDVTDLGEQGPHPILTVRRKGGARQAIPLAPPVVRALGGYLADRGDGPLFLSRTGRRLDRTSAAALLRRVASTVFTPARAKRVHMHALRHAAITLALDAGGTLRDVQDLAGHASPAQTRRYDDARGALERSPTFRLSVYLEEAG
jgi:site-specific recombinase XerD